MTVQASFGLRHGPISCTACFQSDFESGSSLECGGWRINNNPAYWGSSEPEVLILGFSKGANQSRVMQFDKVAFNNARSNLKEILVALQAVDQDADIDACFTASEKKLGFASVIRCGLGMEKEPGKYVTSGDVVVRAIAEGSPVRKYFDGCTLRFLGSLPKSVRTVVFLGLDRTYVEAVYDRMKQLHPSIRRTGTLSYKTEDVTFIHVIHPSPLATSHRQTWLKDDESSLAASRREVAAALGIVPRAIERAAATRSSATAIARKFEKPGASECEPNSDKSEQLIGALLAALSGGGLVAEIIGKRGEGEEKVKKLFRLRRLDGEEFAVERTPNHFQIWSSVRPRGDMRFVDEPEDYHATRTRHSNLDCMPKLRGPNMRRGINGIRAWKLRFETLIEARDYIISAV